MIYNKYRLNVIFFQKNIQEKEKIVEGTRDTDDEEIKKLKKTEKK